MDSGLLWYISVNWSLILKSTNLVQNVDNEGGLHVSGQEYVTNVCTFLSILLLNWNCLKKWILKTSLRLVQSHGEEFWSINCITKQAPSEERWWKFMLWHQLIASDSLEQDLLTGVSLFTLVLPPYRTHTCHHERPDLCLWGGITASFQPLLSESKAHFRG